MSSHHQLKECFSLFSTGVMIAATNFNGHKHALTINSFSSVSLDPPLCLFSIGNNSYNLEAFKNSGSFTLSILSSQQEELAMKFAGHDHENKWQNIDITTSKLENPIFNGCNGFLECRTYKIIEAGDHHIFIGEVIDFAKQSDENALLYYRGGFIS